MTKITGFSPFSADGDRFELDASTTTQCRATGDFLELCERRRFGGVVCASAVSDAARFCWGGPFRRFCLWSPNSRFPETETKAGRDSVRTPVYAEGSPSIWYCRDHSRGMS